MQSTSSDSPANATVVSTDRSARFWIIVLFLLALLLRVAAAFYWQSLADAEQRLFRLGDSHSYWVLAGHIARGEAYQYGSPDARVFRAPLYPLFLAPFTLLSDPRVGVLAARLAGALVGALAVLMLAILARRLGGRATGLWAIALGAIHPSAIGMSIAILSEAVFVPLMMIHLWCWLRSWQAGSGRAQTGWAAALGVAWGLAVLARPSWLLFPVLVLVVGLLCGPGRTRHLRLFFLSALTMAITMMPWWIRNAMVTGRFVPTTLQVGPSLYDALHPGATGASDSGMAFMRDIYRVEKSAEQRSKSPPADTLEYRLNRRAMQEALRWASEHPKETLRLAWRKFRRTWSLWPDGGEIGSFWLRLAITIASFGVLILAAVESLHALRRWNWAYTLCWLPCIYFTLLHMVFVGSVRYREPAIFVLIALAGSGVERGCRWLTERLQGRSIGKFPRQDAERSGSNP